MESWGSVYVRADCATAWLGRPSLIRRHICIANRWGFPPSETPRLEDSKGGALDGMGKGESAAGNVRPYAGSVALTGPAASYASVMIQWMFPQVREGGRSMRSGLGQGRKNWPCTTVGDYDRARSVCAG